MRLLSTDIAKVKRLSLGEVKLPAPELRVEPINPILVERPPTDEEIAYSKLVAINPLIEELVERLDLVSIKTGERIKKVETREEYKPHPRPEIKAQEIDKPKLIALAQRVIEGENSYSREEIIERIKEATNVNQDRAERGFNLILQAGAIEQTINQELYYLVGSTPF
jgi:hypothetical protein